MRYIVSAVVIFLIFASCKKDKFTSVPQITFKSITSPYYYDPSPVAKGPILTLEVTDAEGDLGFNVGVDSSYIFIKNLKSPFKLDSFRFPAALANASHKDFKADVDIDLIGDGFNGGGVLPIIAPNKKDTLFFEVYVTDLKKHKSNVIKTGDPLYYIRP